MRAGPDAIRKVSEAMASTYGLSADDVCALMTKGRFRVKANVDQATADRYARELEALGARVGIEEVAGQARTPPAASTKAHASSPPSAPPGAGPPRRSSERTSGLLQPIREEVRDRAADPAARGPRHRMSSPPLSALSSLPPLLAEIGRDTREDTMPGVVRHRASWPSREPVGAAGRRDRRDSSNPEEAVTSPRLSIAGLPPAPPPWQPAATPPMGPALATRPGSAPPQVGSPSTLSHPELPVPNWDLPPEPESPASSWGLPPQPVRSQVATLPPQPVRPRPPALPQAASRPSLSTLPPQGGRSQLSALSPQPESRPVDSTLPPQPAARSSVSTLPPPPASRSSASTLPQPTRRPTRPSLPPQTASRPTPRSLPAHVASRPTPSSLPAHVASRPAPSSLPPQTPSRPARSSLLPVMALEPTALMELEEPPIQLGALERSGALALATLDAEAASGVPGSHPDRVSLSPASTQAAPAAVDRFAPPGTHDDEDLVELAEDDLEWTRRMPASPGLPADPALMLAPASGPQMPAVQFPSDFGVVSSSATAPALRAAQLPSAPSWLPSPVLAPTPRRERRAPRTRVATQTVLAASPRARLVAGFVLAIVLGFVPAHIVASWREDEAFRTIDARVIAAHAAADSPASYDALDGMRAGQLEAKRSVRNAIALTSLLVWAAAGGAVAYAWFRLPRARLGH